MIEPKDIGWASYREYEGPFFRGRCPYRLPAPATETDKFMAVITATEGGRFDAYNGYDRCDATSGLIQWCDRGQFSVCDMLGAVAQDAPSLIEPVTRYADSVGVDFKPNARGRWRFFFRDARGEVDRATEQDQLYHLSSNGRRGSWDDASRAHGKGWAAAISSVWQAPAAQELQMEFTAMRLTGFIQPSVKELVVGAPQTNLGMAFRAAYLSYAANNPTWAARYLLSADLGAGRERYSAEWLVAVLKELTFGPGVAIYPGRYNAIRPVLERLYGIDLPDFAKELKTFVAVYGATMTVEEVQQIVKTLGFDLGPAGVDGIYGRMTRAAVVSFQEVSSLEPTGFVDHTTADALRRAADALITVGRAEAGLSPEDRRRASALVLASLVELGRKAAEDARAR